MPERWYPYEERDRGCSSENMRPDPELLETLNPDPHQSIWRYLDFPKFVWMLETSSFYFARLDLLGDPFEGSVTPQDLRAEEDTWLEMAEYSGTPPGLYEEFHRAVPFDPRHRLFVNCWHMSEMESVAMWRLYSGEQKGIAIRSRVDRLRAQLPESARIRRVQYLDYRTDTVGRLSPAYCKRAAFEYEREIRAVVPADDQMSERGVAVSVDLNAVITEVRLSPGMPSWLADLTTRVASKYGLAATPVRSDLDGAPSFNWRISDGSDE